MRNIGLWVLNRLDVLLSVWTNLAIIHVLDEFRNDLSHKKRVVAVLQYIISGNP